VDYTKVFLEALDRPAVVEIVTGLQRTRRLRDRYGLDIEPGVAEAIAHDVTADRESPVAPTLQVLLSRMWRDALVANAHAPCFSAAAYDRLKNPGIHLSDFFDLQVATLRTQADLAGSSRSDVVDSGLVLDVLMYHTTPFGTAEQRRIEELQHEYG